MAADTSWATMPYPGAADEDEGRNSHDESAADAVAEPCDERSREDEKGQNLTNEPNSNQVARNSEPVLESELGSKNASNPPLDNVAGFARTNQHPPAAFLARSPHVHTVTPRGGS
jgi:hypothetical protein